MVEKEILEILKNMQSDIKEVKIKQNETYQIVKALRKDLSTVEIVTANNYADIAKLKAVK